MGFGFQANHTLNIANDKVVACGMILGGKLLYDGTFGKGHIILIGRDDVMRILLSRALYHLEETAFHLFSVDNEGSAKYLMTAML